MINQSFIRNLFLNDLSQINKNVINQIETMLIDFIKNNEFILKN
jgi:hypothetical protein